MDHDDAIDLPLRLLHWYREMGVDGAVGGDAIDWLSRGDSKPGASFVAPRSATPRGQAPAVTVRPTQRETLAPQQRPDRRELPATAPANQRAFVATAPDAAVQNAREAAAGAQTVELLGEALSKFDGCGLKATAKNLCFYRGAANAHLMVVGEAPGREDDLAGTPFAGPAGELLDKMLAAIGVSPATCHITNAVYWRPPGNRHPTTQELDVCQHFLHRQTALVAPKILLLLGASAARQVIDAADGIMRVRGKWHDVVLGGHRVRVIASLAPSYLIKVPSSKQSAWRDLLAVKAALAE